MIKILITEFMEKNAVDILKSKFDVTYEPELFNNNEKLSKIISEYHGLIVRNKTNVNQKILEKASNLKIIGRLGVGLDNIDTTWCKVHNILVQPATGMNANSVAEYVINSSLILMKNTFLLHQRTINGEWPRTTIQSKELKGKTLGLIGFGVIAREVNLLAKAFNLNVISHDPFVNQSVEDLCKIKLVELENIFENAEIISIHLPLNDKTKSLINYESFYKMKKKPIIINSSRGSIINENDLLKAYKNGLISGFAIDVYTTEPVGENFIKQISNDINCILSPHIAGITLESNIRVSNFIADKICSFFNK